MPFTQLSSWLEHWLTQHPSEIALGLDRVRVVWERLGAPKPAAHVIVVAGTNGKGSTVAFLDAIFRNAGYRVGRYTSPHLLRYNERIAIQNEVVGDDRLIDAFARIEAIRGDIPLTYFEAGTLAALLIFSEAHLDLAVLEVGLGGRLDAVNLIDADIAVVTTIDLDHQDYLGNTRDLIAVEKAGIFRHRHPAIIGDTSPPAALLAEIQRIGALAVWAGQDFHWRVDENYRAWEWWNANTQYHLPMPQLAAPVQIANAATAIATVQALATDMPVPISALHAGIQYANLPGRLQLMSHAPELVMDIAHNPQGARALAEWLARHPKPTYALFSALGDKDIANIVTPLHQHIQHWHVCGLNMETVRGLSADAVLARMPAYFSVQLHLNPEIALQAALHLAKKEERILVFGSFYLVAALMRG